MNNRLIRCITAALACSSAAILLPVERVAAQTGDVPTVIQAALFVKIFGYEKKLAPKTKFALCIPYSSASDTTDNDIAAQFRAVNVEVDFVSESKVTANLLKRYDAVYFFATVNARMIREFLSKESVLSITGNAQFVHEGTASVGIALENSKPRIVVNKSRVQSEKKDFSADFMKAAKVVE